MTAAHAEDDTLSVIKIKNLKNMTTKNSFYAFAALAALTLAGCNNDEEVIPQDDLKDTPISVTAGVDGMLTRAGYATDNLPSTFYLTVKQNTADESSHYNYTNVLMKKGTDNSYTSNREMLWMNSEPRTPFVCAYTTDGTTFAVQTDQSSKVKVEESDLLGAVSGNPGDVSINGSTISIKFHHLLCKLDLTYKWNGEVASEEIKSIDGVTISGMNTKVTLDPAKATVSDESTPGDVKAYVTEITEGEESYKSEVIFAPSATSPKVTITTTVNAARRTFIATLTAPDGGFTSGKCYSATLTIGKDVATVSNVSVSKFEDAGSNLADGETEQTISLVLDATNMSDNDLKEKVIGALSASVSTHRLDITLPANPDNNMFTAIRRALIDTDYVADGSVVLTLRGVTTVCDYAFGESYYGNEYVAELKSVILPDAININEDAFLGCENLTEIVAPKVQTVQDWAFGNTGIVSVEFPEATEIKARAFFNCNGLTTIKLPKVVSLGDQALDCKPESELTIYLTSASEITVNKDCFYNSIDKVNLVLNVNKRSQVNGNTWTVGGNSLSFKSISFAE